MKKAIVSILFNSTTLVAVLFGIIILSSGVVSAGTLLSVADGFIGGVKHEVSSFNDVNRNIPVVILALSLVALTVILTKQQKEKTKSVQKIN